MIELSKLLDKVIHRKNLGYVYHRFYPKYDNQTMSMRVEQIDIDVAKSILRIQRINNEEDLFLGLCCVALLSSCEKRNRSYTKADRKDLVDEKTKDTYLYKSFIKLLIYEGLINDLDFKFCEGKDNRGETVTYVSVAGVQFSYHFAGTSDMVELAKKYDCPQYQEMEWDQNIKFQNGAKEALLFALHLKNLSKLKLIEETPKEYALSLINIKKPTDEVVR